MSKIKKLVVREFVVQPDSGIRNVGEKFCYFFDPKTGKYYEPVEGFSVEGEDLSDRFREVS